MWVITDHPFDRGDHERDRLSKSIQPGEHMVISKVEGAFHTPTAAAGRRTRGAEAAVRRPGRESGRPRPPEDVLHDNGEAVDGNVPEDTIAHHRTSCSDLLGTSCCNTTCSGGSDNLFLECYN
jgi:hypothetical protein